MRGRGKFPSAALLLVLVLVLLDFINYAWLLSAPSRVSIESVDMRHVLRWRHLQASCSTTVLYSVQIQGEFELRILNGSWLDAPDCQQIPHAHCDLTSDLGSDSDYNVQVRAQCGSQVSPWTKLSRPFNRRQTLLKAPEMTVAALGDALQVSFKDLPLTAVVSVTVWRKGHELQADSYVVPVEQAGLHIAALQEGAVYCVRAQTHLDTQHRSSSTDTHCVTISGPEASWKTPTTVAAVTVFSMAGFLFAVFWSIVHYKPAACKAFFQKEPLPRSLVRHQ
ncbi:interleukin-20 receptor subunit beta [Diretmus argenteus]